MTMLLKNGRVTDGGGSRDCDVFIRDGIIAEVKAGIDCAADEVIDCAGLAVIPGICDMHVHLRDPGQTHKETLASGSMAAAAGGVTAVVCMPNTSPPIDSPELVRDIIERAKAEDVQVKVYPCAAITKGLQGAELANGGDYAALKAAGAVAVSDDGRPVESAGLMMKAMRAAHEAGLRVISHCEDLDIVAGGIINKGDVSEELNVPGISRSSENISTAREICLAGDLYTHIHIAHVSTKESIAFIRAAAERGIMVTCETAPHYFMLTELELLRRDADYRMNPPLREAEDVAEITAALCHGAFDCIASDHAPHTSDEKSDFPTAPNGVVGLETLLAATLTRLYHGGGVSLENIVRMLCVNPRRILGIGGGSIGAGSVADIAVVDLGGEWVVEPQKLHSKSKNTCFKGMTLKGRVKYTIVDGKVVYRLN